MPNTRRASWARSTDGHGTVDKPWYRHFWVWFVLAPLVATLLASAITAWLAGAPPALVVDEFVPVAMAVERDQARDRHAAALGLRAHLALGTRHADGQDLVVTLDGAAPPSLQLALVHPTLATHDRAATLERRGAQYAGRIPRTDTRLYVQLGAGSGADEWRLTGVLEPGQDTLELAADR